MNEIIDEMGGTNEVARICRVAAASVSEWRVRGIPVNQCPAIERASKGKYRCEALSPHAPWLRVADKSWAWHPKGRPVLDVARAAQ